MMNAMGARTAGASSRAKDDAPFEAVASVMAVLEDGPR